MTLVFTIGHSNHDWSTFKRLLETADIGAIADVRSSPASRLRHFNRSALKVRLNAPAASLTSSWGSNWGDAPRAVALPTTR
jgi:hypothetical protein